MKALLALAAFASGTALAATPGAPPAKAPAMGWFGTLAGHCWEGRTDDGKVSDTQCYTLQYGRIVRGTIRAAGEPAPFEGDSAFSWDARTSRIRYAQWSSAGSLTANEAFYEGELLRFPDRTRPDGTVPGRTTWRRIDADSFVAVRERADGGGWKDVLSVTYRKVR